MSQVFTMRDRLRREIVSPTDRNGRHGHTEHSHRQTTRLLREEPIGERAAHLCPASLTLLTHVTLQSRPTTPKRHLMRVVILRAMSAMCVMGTVGITGTLAMPSVALAETAPESSPSITQQTTEKTTEQRTDDASSGTQNEAVIAAQRPHTAVVDLTGLSGDLNDNAQIYIRSATSGGLTPLSSFDRQRIVAAVRDALSALGYFSPTIETRWEAAGEKAILHVSVQQGDPVTIAETHVTITGDGEKEPFFEPLLAGVPKPGTVLNQSDYDTLKNNLMRVALENGYFKSQFTEHELGVQRATRKAYWRLTLETGPRYRFGPVVFTGSQIRDEYLRNLVPFRQGEPYTNERFSKLTQSLNETGWFSTVIVVPKPEDATEDAEMPVVATLAPRIKNTMDVALGFTTDSGPHASLDWKKPWINDRGMSLMLETELNKDEPSAGVTLKIPLARQPLQHYYTVSADYEKTSLNDTESDQLEVSVARHWNYENRWQREVHLNYLRDTFTQGDVHNSTSVLYPGIQFKRTRSRGDTFPTWGDTQVYTFDVASDKALSDVTFQRFTFNQTWVRTPWAGHRFVGRWSLGWLNTNHFDLVPPDLRFFAGGDRSIRGYDYKSVSPTDSEGRLTGAKRLATASIEYQHQVSGPWWAAAFVDGGEAVNTFTNVKWKIGVGAGVRWISPIGPIKLDLAFPTREGFSLKNAHLYFALGSEL